MANEPETPLGSERGPDSDTIVPLQTGSDESGADSDSVVLVAAETLDLPDDPRAQAGAYDETIASPDAPGQGETVVLPDGENVTASDPELTSRLSAVIAEGDDAVEIAEALRDPTRRLGRYVVLRELGKGGMGVVLKAFDPRLCRLVAIKQILGEVDRQSALRFAREARLTAQLRHPNIAPVYEGVSSGEGSPYIVMEYVRGKALIDVCRDSPMPGREAAEVLAPIADAIQFAHSKGIVHRDLKPHNIMLADDGPPVVLDFGLARRDGSESVTLTAAGGVVGTPAYMAPEQASGAADVGPAADIYGLGATLYECLTGRPPFSGPSTMAVLRALQDQEARPPRERNPRVHRDLETICLKCLEKAPAERYASAKDLAKDLRHFIAGEPISGRRAPTAVRLLRKAWRRREVTFPTLVGLLLVATLVPALFSLQKDKAQAELETAAAELERVTEAKAQEKANSDRQRATLQEALGLLERLDAVRRFRFRPLLPPDEEAKLISGARAQIAVVISRLDLTLAKAPELPDVHVLRGRAALHLLDLDTAAKSAQDAIARDETSAAAWLLLAETQTQRLALEFMRPSTPMETKRAWATEGQRAFNEAKRLGSEAPPVAQAWYHILAMENDQAKALLDHADKEFPSEEVQFARAILESQLHGTDTAVISSFVTPQLDKALRLCPRMVPALYARGVSHREAGRLDTAIADFKAVTRLEPDFALAHYDLGQALSELGDGPASERAMARVLELEPENQDAWNGRGFAIFIQGRPADAIPDFDRSIAIEPTAVAHCNRGLARVRLGDRRGGIADYTSAIAVDPDYVGAYSNRGLAKAAEGDVSGGIADLTTAIERDPSYVTAYVNRAKFRLETRDIKGALADAQRAIKVQPTLPDAWWWSGLARAMRGEFSAAIGDLDEAIRLRPDYQLGIDLRGSIKQTAGDLVGAANDFEQSLRLAPNQEGRTAKRAFIRRHLGRPSKF